MKIALVGYGKMNRLVEQLAPQYDCEIALKLDSTANQNGAGINTRNFSGIDVAIEFSTPASAVSNINRLAAIGVSMVIGTTGWFAELPRITELVREHGIGLVWGPNFSIGAQVFARIVAEAAHLLAEQPGYEAWAWEIHHSAKKDAPSGTLLRLVETMLESGWTKSVDQAANRAGAVPGTHEIGFDSSADTITLRHTARSREGFARGALEAARWIANKKGVHEFASILFKR